MWPIVVTRTSFYSRSMFLPGWVDLLVQTKEDGTTAVRRCIFQEPRHGQDNNNTVGHDLDLDLMSCANSELLGYEPTLISN